MEVIRSPVSDANTEAIGLHDNKMNTWELKTTKTEYKNTYRDLDYFYCSWDLWKATQKLDAMYEPLWALNLIFPDIYPWGMIWHGHDRIRKLMDNAMYTFEKRLDEEVEKNEAVLSEGQALRDRIRAGVLEDYKHDLALFCTKFYAHILKAIVMPPFNKLAVPAAEAVLKPINDMIPDAMKDFIDLNDMFEEWLHKVIDGAIVTVVNA